MASLRREHQGVVDKIRNMEKSTSKDLSDKEYKKERENLMQEEK